MIYSSRSLLALSACFVLFSSPAFASSKAAEAGIAAYRSGDYRQAAHLLDETIHEELSGDCDAMYYRANAFLKLDRPQWAIEHYRKARALAKDGATIEQCDQAISWLTNFQKAKTNRNGGPQADLNTRQPSQSQPNLRPSSSIVAKPSQTNNYSDSKPGEPSAYDLSLITVVEGDPDIDEVYSAVSKAVSLIPTRIKHQIADDGISWVVCPKLVDYYPAMANLQSRGWAPGQDYRYVAGCYSPKFNKVLIGVRALRTFDGVMATRGHRLQTTLHETGHAYDKVLKFYSRDPVFRAAYESDCAKLTAVQRQKLKYFLQESNAGLSETFAELFAESLMLKANVPFELPDGIDVVFPNTLEVMRRLLRL